MDLHEIAKAFTPDSPSWRPRQGVIDHVNADGTVGVRIGGDSTVVDNVKALMSAPAGATVWLLVAGRDLFVLGALGPPKWHVIGAAGEPGFQNGWSNYNTADYHAAAFCRDSDGFVHLRGLVKGGTIGDVGVFTLPSGYRPGRRSIFSGLGGGDLHNRTDVAMDGTIRVETGSNAYVSLEGITFFADGS